MGVTKKAIYAKSASQICYKESNFIFASSCFGTRTCFTKFSKTKTPQQSAQTIPTQNQQTKNVCADLFCIVLYCIIKTLICEECKKLEKTSLKHTQKHSKNTIVKTFKI